MAVLKGAEASVLLHLRRGAPLEARDDRGRTPLILAAQAGRAATCRLLIAEGADTGAVDAEGRTAADAALAAGHYAVHALLAPRTIAPARSPAPAASVVEPPTSRAEPTLAEGFSLTGSDGDDDGGWAPEDAPDTSLSDQGLATSLASTQSGISTHRNRATEDAWAGADINIPQPARPGRPPAALPAGSAQLFARALSQGWIDEARITADLTGASPEQGRIAAAALELSGICILPSSAWTEAVFHPTPRNPLPVRREGLAEALELYEEMLGEATDPLDIYKAGIARHAAPGKDEEARLFASLGDARTALLIFVRRNRVELSTWLDRIIEASQPGDIGDNPESIGDDIDVNEDADGGDLLAGDLEPLRILFAEHAPGKDMSGSALPYAGFARLLDAAPAGARWGGTGIRLARALERFRHARDRVAAANLKLVIWAARRYVRAPFPAMDLVQEGNIGLLRAIEKFDPARGNRFSTYATWWIRQAMTRAITDQARIVRIPVHAAEVLPRLERLDAAFRSRINRAAADAEAAAELDRMPLLIRRLREAPVEPVPLDGALDGSAWFPALGPRTLSHPEYECFTSDRRAGVTRLLGQLNAREERVLRMRFGIGIAADMTLEEVGQTFDVTRERIRQIEAKALRRLMSPTRLRDLRQFS